MRNTVLAERLSMRAERMPRLLEGDVGLPGGGDSAVDAAIRSYNGGASAGSAGSASGESAELRMPRADLHSDASASASSASAVEDAIRAFPNAQPPPPPPPPLPADSDENSAVVVPGPTVEGALSAAKTLLDPSGMIKPDKLRVCLPMGMGPREQVGLQPPVTACNRHVTAAGRPWG